MIVSFDSIKDNDCLIQQKISSRTHRIISTPEMKNVNDIIILIFEFPRGIEYPLREGYPGNFSGPGIALSYRGIP
jgi:hypothetical protein